MNKRSYILLAIALFFVTMAANAQVRVKAAIDSAEILIGEQTKVRVVVEHPKGVSPVFPTDLQPLMKKGVEVIGRGTTSEIDDKTTGFTFTLTSFDPSLYYIPPINIKVGQKVYATNQLALKVNDVKVDTTHIDKFFGPKEIIDPVYTWRDWMRVFLLSILLLACCAATFFAAKRMLSTKKKVVVKKQKKTPIPPHKEAELEIAKLKSEYSSEELTSKDYYTSLVDILRRYVSKRYGFRADEMTSYELVEHLIDLDDKQSAATSSGETATAIASAAKPDYSELREILATADLTKFAKLKTDAGEDERNLARLSQYIETTKSDTPPAPVPDETTPAEPERPTSNPRKKKAVILAAAIAATACVAALTAYEIFELLL